MLGKLETWPVMTMLAVPIVLTGCALVILAAVDLVPDPALRLKYSDLIDALIGIGLLGIGRGLAKR